MRKVLFSFVLTLFAYPVLGISFSNPFEFIRNINDNSQNSGCTICLSLHDSEKQECPESFIKQAVLSSDESSLLLNSAYETCLNTELSSFKTPDELESYIKNHPEFSAVKQAPALSSCLSQNVDVSQSLDVSIQGYVAPERTLSQQEKLVTTAEYYSTLQRLNQRLDKSLSGIAGIDLLVSDKQLMSDISCEGFNVLNSKDLSGSCQALKQCSSDQSGGNSDVGAGTTALQDTAQDTLVALKIIETIDEEIKSLTRQSLRNRDKGQTEDWKTKIQQIKDLKTNKKTLENMYPWIVGSQFKKSYKPRDFNSEDEKVDQEKINKMAGIIKKQLVDTRKSLKKRQDEMQSALACVMYNHACNDVNMDKVLAKLPRLNNEEIFNRAEVRKKISEVQNEANRTQAMGLIKEREVDNLFSSVDCLQEQRAVVKGTNRELGLASLDMALVLGTVGIASGVALSRVALRAGGAIATRGATRRGGLTKMQGLGIVGADAGVSVPYMQEAFSLCEDSLNQLEIAGVNEGEENICKSVSAQSKLTRDMKSCVLHASIASLPLTIPAVAGVTLFARKFTRGVGGIASRDPVSLAIDELGELEPDQAEAVMRRY